MQGQLVYSNSTHHCKITID